MNVLSSSSMLNRLTSTYPVSDYLPALVKNTFTELSTGAKPSSYRMAMQRTLVDNLIDYYTSNKTAAASGVVLQQLRKLQRMCRTAESSAHFASLSDVINRALVVK